MKPLARWTIGPVSCDGFRCLEFSINSFLKFHNAEVVICFNCDPCKIPASLHCHILHDQRPHESDERKPKGVAWKLYPPRLAPDRHEILIDNDIVFNEAIPEIQQFFASDAVLLLEAESRTYGRFEKFVPPGYFINSGIYGMPPQFDLKKYVEMYGGKEWEANAHAEHKASFTFDEQGLIAFALLHYPRQLFIPSSSVTNCERHLIPGKGYHFISMNRLAYHSPFRMYQASLTRLYL